MKTGDVIEIGKKGMDVIETFTEEKARLDVMFNVLSGKTYDNEKKFWNTIHGLYPEAKDFDLHVNWEKKEITLRQK